MVSCTSTGAGVSATGSVDGVHVDIENSQKTKAVKVNVREGDLVKKGDVLFEFDSTDLKEQYEKLSSKYEKELSKHVKNPSDNFCKTKIQLIKQSYGQMWMV